jgi:hypothetical protein
MSETFSQGTDSAVPSKVATLSCLYIRNSFSSP